MLIALGLLASAPAAAAPTYAATIEGAPKDLKDKLALISELMKEIRDYPTAAALRRAARRDIEAFDEALRSAGYYDGKASFTLEEAPDGKTRTVVFQIDTGKLFHIAEYEILYQDDAEGRPTSLDAAQLKPDGAADGAALRDMQEKFLRYLWNDGYPAAEIVTRRVIADFETGETNAVFVFKSGPKAQFGDLRITGAQKTKENFLQKMITWEPGDEYERKKVTAYYDRLNNTALFASIEIAPGDVDENGKAPILLDVTERKQRTIGAGLSYSTTEGPGARLFFEHRNFFGNGETFRAEASGSKIEQALDLSLTRPLPRIGARAFATAALANETTDAFNARSLELQGGVSKKWLKEKLETRGSLALETANVRSDGIEERTYLLSTPLAVVWNSEDSLLDAKKGVRASWTVTPYIGSDTFTQSEIAVRSRVEFGSDHKVTLAARAAFAATFNQTLANLPLNKRYYAGGGGSVRGYGYQEAGPLDVDGDPIGGLSRIEGAFEARVMAVGNVQLAAFVDAGSVSPNEVPDFKEKFYVGYGGGVRYRTPIGPIRLDVAFPVAKRETDSGFQIYIGLGQSF